MIRVLYAHPDRWIVGAEFPPEERARMRTALTGFAMEWLAWKSPAKLEHEGRQIDDSEEQQRALAAWRESAAEYGKRARRTSARGSRGASGHGSDATRRGGGSSRGPVFDPRPVIEASIDAVVTGALWESPVFRMDGGSLSFHRAWRIVLDVTVKDERALAPLATRWGLLVRNR